MLVAAFCAVCVCCSLFGVGCVVVCVLFVYVMCDVYSIVVCCEMVFARCCQLVGVLCVGGCPTLVASSQLLVGRVLLVC